MPPVDRKNPVRAKSSDSRYSLMEFVREFGDDDACLEHLWRTRYSRNGTHARCPKCEQRRAFKKYETDQRRQSWTCTACGHHLHPTAGTIFHKSSTSLHLWFYGIYLITSNKTGLSAKQLERELGVTYKTAWRMFNLIRNSLMKQDGGPLSGDVEVDETAFGGKPRLSSGIRTTQDAKRWADANKTTVFGMVERGGRVKATTVPNREKATLQGVVTEHVQPAQ